MMIYVAVHAGSGALNVQDIHSLTEWHELPSHFDAKLAVICVFIIKILRVDQMRSEWCITILHRHIAHSARHRKVILAGPRGIWRRYEREPLAFLLRVVDIARDMLDRIAMPVEVECAEVADALKRQSFRCLVHGAQPF